MLLRQYVSNVIRVQDIKKRMRELSALRWLRLAFEVNPFNHFGNTHVCLLIALVASNSFVQHRFQRNRPA